ncbi:MAG TPA: PadR family transcriptional regulator [Bryobacteraceae bacterium]|jgi:DNA-binding PadR family transcriptional regulator|nr:PadR family transcriptional regulator [Bryobacteraceae bacterium]
MSSEKLTVPDLVLLSLLAERAMHGYEANALLEFRKVRDWAGVSRPQIYYSLDKVAARGLIRVVRVDEGDEEEAEGPERRVFETTAKGRAALADALERADWTEQSERPLFLTWVALSWQCRPGVFLKQVRARRAFVEREILRRREVLAAIRKEVGHRFHEAIWMVSLNIEQLRTETRWLRKVEREYPRRAAARSPEYGVKK